MRKAYGYVWSGLLLGALACAPRARAEEALPTKVALSCEQLESEALAFHPWLERDGARVHAARERTRSTGRLDAPELVYQQWAVPLARPYALNEANMIMLGVRQRVRLGGLRQAETRAEDAVTRTEESARRVTREEVLREVRLAYVAYARAYEERALHGAHAALVDETLNLAQIAYASGLAAQSSLLEGRSMLAELHAEIAGIDAELASARLTLNALTGRDLDDELGPPCTEASAAAVSPLAVRAAAEHKPEVAVATGRVNEARAELELEQKAARSPELMLGLDYMAMPEAGQPYGYGAMVSMTLPWLQAGPKHAQRAKTFAVREREQERAWVVRSAELEARRALVAEHASAQTRLSIERDLLPAALRRYEAERIALSSGKTPATGALQALAELLGARIALVRARAAQREAHTELVRALGSPNAQTPSQEVTP